MTQTIAFLSGLLIAAVVAGCSAPKAELLVALPDYCNTPDGMCLMPDNSIIVSIPNFNDETRPPLLMKITADGKRRSFMNSRHRIRGWRRESNRIGAWASRGRRRATSTWPT